MENLDRGLHFIVIDLNAIKIYIFINELFANNKDLSSYSTKSKRITRSVLALEIYRIINGNNNLADAMIKANPNRALETFLDTNALTICMEGWVKRDKQEGP
ncbi:hypothetical protein LCER1_G002695 [Lachnellula cervina]|uniref:Uncharacterized protein n=1 Tax=Lachnellula cervina TaxID=1316786 RepID=A0A7D8YR35_9HELO|nr:hypothetical protein LCER1_G002695 [Lachnellula cervina]